MNIVFADKPAGVATHTSFGSNAPVFADREDGFVEHLASRLHRELFVAHRLDRDTSGAICFAKDKETAESLRALFVERKINKAYLFITDRKFTRTSFEVRSRIEKRGKSYVSTPATSESEEGADNALTRFTLVEEMGRFSLWRAEPVSGKPHQIRLHAASESMPLLGDTLYGGTPFPALCLHSVSFQITPELRTESPEPRWFRSRELLENPRLCGWVAAIERRERLLRSYGEAFGPTDDLTVRWIHSEGDPLRAEKLGEVVSVYWFGENMPSAGEARDIERLAEIMGWKKWYLQHRGNRGKTPNAEEFRRYGEFPEKWVASENGLRFEFRVDSGLSPGLFLDQRQNRHWVRENTKGLRVLNLFCYTAGFSVAAARGGAKQVVSVDLSKAFLEWGKINFALNELSPEGHEFRAMDSREYLAWAAKKKLEFDLVICDPPSFSRSKEGLFRIEKDFDGLFMQLMKVVAPGGRLLFSSNFEGWEIEDLAKRAEKALEKHEFSAKLGPTPSPDWDFELPHHPRNMKSLFVTRL